MFCVGALLNSNLSLSLGLNQLILRESGFKSEAVLKHFVFYVCFLKTD